MVCGLQMVQLGIGLWSQTAIKHNLLSKQSFLVYPSLEKLQLSYMNNGDLPSFLCVHGVNVWTFGHCRSHSAAAPNFCSGSKFQGHWHLQQHEKHHKVRGLVAIREMVRDHLISPSPVRSVAKSANMLGFDSDARNILKDQLSLQFNKNLWLAFLQVCSETGNLQEKAGWCDFLWTCKNLWL